MPYSILIKKNGRTYGTLGPYAKRSDALADAAALKRPGHNVSVLRSNPAPALAAAGKVALQMLLPYLIQAAAKMAKGTVKKYLSMNRKEQIAFIRKSNRFNPVVRPVLASNAAANAAAAFLDETLRSGAGDALIDTATAAAHSKAGTTAIKKAANPRRRRSKSRSRRNKTRKPDWIKREGKLGGPGFLDKSELAQKRLLTKSVKKHGYRSTLGSIMVLERNRTIKRRHGKELENLRKWLVGKYGGPGSFGPRN
jgi:hypothetical protein